MTLILSYWDYPFTNPLHLSAENTYTLKDKGPTLCIFTFILPTDLANSGSQV